jgi:hypothetical protein
VGFHASHTVSDRRNVAGAVVRFALAQG